MGGKGKVSGIMLPQNWFAGLILILSGQILTDEVKNCGSSVFTVELGFVLGEGLAVVSFFCGR